MKMKVSTLLLAISMFFLVSNSASFALEPSTVDNELVKNQTNTKVTSDSENKDTITEDTKDDQENDSNDDENDGQKNNSNDDENDDQKNDSDDATMNNLSDEIQQMDAAKPEDIIKFLTDKNISVEGIISVFEHLSNKKSNDKKSNDKNKHQENDTVESYADALHEKINEHSDANDGTKQELEKLSDLYDKIGNLEKALDLEREIVKTNFSDIEAYKKLGEDLNKKGEKEVKVFVNGEQINFDVVPIVKDGRTLVPIHAIAEALKCKVEWNPLNRTVLLTKNGVEIKLTINDRTAYVNGNQVKLDVPAQTLNGRTIIPVNFVSKAFNTNINWEPVYKTVVIFDGESTQTPTPSTTPAPSQSPVLTPEPTPAVSPTPVPTPAVSSTPVPTPAVSSTPVPTPAI